VDSETFTGFPYSEPLGNISRLISLVAVDSKADVSSYSTTDSSG
jgi:hypothetical protein